MVFSFKWWRVQRRFDPVAGEFVPVGRHGAGIARGDMRLKKRRRRACRHKSAGDPRGESVDVFDAGLTIIQTTLNWRKH